MASLSEVCQKLWELDRKRFKRGEDYEINLEGINLFSFVDVRKLHNIYEFPTYSAFIQLLNNYESETSAPEEVTEGKINKSRAFLNRCLESAVMEEARSYLLRKGRLPQGKKAFKELLFDLWFELHPRPNGDGTERSAFEHVFVGETCRGQVRGFHNWVQLYLEERQGNVIYEDFYRTACDDRIITIDFTWNNNNKTFGSFFLGTSPEFELAIYTVCFLAGDEDETTVTLGNRPATIITYHENGQIGACYPKLQGQIQMPESQYSIIPIESEESSTPEEDQEIEDQPETVRLIIPEENQFSSRNGEVCIPIAPVVDRARYLDERKPTRDYCCTIL